MAFLLRSNGKDKDKIWVTAPYAVAVEKGINVTADPPQTTPSKS